MRRLLACASTVLLLAACGSSSSSSAAPPPQSGITGTIAGQPFTAADTSAIALSQGTCSFGGTSANATGLVVGIGSFGGLCSFVTQHQLCGIKANATVVTLLLVRANVTGSTVGPVQPGTYTIGGTNPTPDAQGNLTVAQALVDRRDASCAEPASFPTVTGGTVKITAVGARVTGTVDLTFSDGGHVAGGFDTPTCAGVQTDVCTALSGGGCSSQACVP